MQADLVSEDGGFGEWGRRTANSDNSASGGPCDHHPLLGLVGRVFLPLYLVYRIDAYPCTASMPPVS